MQSIIAKQAWLRWYLASFISSSKTNKNKMEAKCYGYEKQGSRLIHLQNFCIKRSAFAESKKAEKQFRQNCSWIKLKFEIICAFLDEVDCILIEISLYIPNSYNLSIWKPVQTCEPCFVGQGSRPNHYEGTKKYHRSIFLKDEEGQSLRFFEFILIKIERGPKLQN